MYVKITVCFSDIQTKHINAAYGQNVDLLDAFVQSDHYLQVCLSVRGTTRLPLHGF